MTLTDKAYDGAVELLRRLYGRRIAGQPVLDTAQHFPGAERFLEQAGALREEALAIARNLSGVPRFHEIMAQQAQISAADARDWRMLVVKAYGVTIARNAERCPILARLAESVPDVLSATLSFLAPRKVIPPHRGPFRGVIRYYLGLSVPPTADGRPGTVLTVDGQEHRIGDGQALLWDDTFVHDVRNETDGVRIALLLDIRRRGMPTHLEMLTRLLVGAAGTAVRMSKLA